MCIRKNARDWCPSLGFPNTIPDRSTIWVFKERLTKNDCLDLIWEELQRQSDDLGSGLQRGVM